MILSLVATYLIFVLYFNKLKFIYIYLGYNIIVVIHNDVYT